MQSQGKGLFSTSSERTSSKSHTGSRTSQILQMANPTCPGSKAVSGCLDHTHFGLYEGVTHCSRQLDDKGCCCGLLSKCCVDPEAAVQVAGMLPQDANVRQMELTAPAVRHNISRGHLQMQEVISLASFGRRIRQEPAGIPHNRSLFEVVFDGKLLAPALCSLQSRLE